MAYAGVISLKHTLEQLLDSGDDLLTQIIESVYQELNSLLKHLKELDSRSRRRCMNAMDEGLREELCKFEDVIESHISNQLLSQSLLQLQGHPLSFSADLQDLKPEIETFTVTLKKMKSAYLRESNNTHDDDDDDDNDDVSSRLANSGGNRTKIVRYSDRIPHIKGELILPAEIVRTKLFLLVGMAGIGKTTLAKEIFEDTDIVECFDYRVWVRLGRKNYTYTEIARRILAQLDPADSDKLVSQEDEEINRGLQKKLETKRCFIVLDDVWDAGFTREVVHQDKLRGSRVLLTTRLHQVAVCTSNQYSLKMQLLNKEESWHLFCATMFDEELCPHELVKPGKKIVEKCEGLPLLIVAITNLLSKTDNNVENWNKVAEDKKNRLLKDACKEIEEVLFPSYHHLPQYLKTCFLYMGVFPQDCEVPKSIIIKLWTAEGLLELDEYEKNSYTSTMQCLNELVQNNVLIIYQESMNGWPLTDRIKTCGLHISFWHMCNREAEKNKFLHVINNVKDGLEECLKGHRRLCIHNNVVFGIKNVYTSIQRVCASTARSVLCFGLYHNYSVPMCFGLRLLKVFDALAIRFYDFPLQVLKLVLLRYLALTCNGKLPASIIERTRLQFLIVGRHLSIKSNGSPSYLPMEIWDMKELQHLQVMGSDLPHPCGKLLQKLFTLIGVSANSCTKEVLQAIPHLQKLGILIESMPEALHEPLHCFDHISNLNELQSLKCVVVNPTFVNPPTTPFPVMPSCLQKLHLSGLGYTWEYMTVIASLPNLRELKLRCYAFRGPKWEIQENHFPLLGFLLIEDTDLVQLKAGSESFRWLSHISMKHCYKLQELHLDIRTSLVQLELVDCNPVAVKDVQQKIKDKLIKDPYNNFVVHSSWNYRNLKSSQPTSSKRKFLKAQ